MVWRALFWVAMWSIFWLLLVQLELVAISPDGTYGSDARYYYEAMHSTIEAGKWWPPADTLTPGYVAFGTFVLHTSPGDSVVWVKLANIGLLLISLAFSFYILQSWGISKRVAYFIIMLAGTNGIVTWMVVRNLKDTLFLFLTLALITGMGFFLSKEHHAPVFLRVSGILLVGLVCVWALGLIRPWGSYWAFGIIGATIVELLFKKELGLKISKSLFFGTLALSLVLIVWLLASYQAAIQDFSVLIDYARRAGGLVGVTPMDIILAIPRFNWSWSYSRNFRLGSVSSHNFYGQHTYCARSICVVVIPSHIDISYFTRSFLLVKIFKYIYAIGYFLGSLFFCLFWVS